MSCELLLVDEETLIIALCLSKSLLPLSHFKKPKIKPWIKGCLRHDSKKIWRNRRPEEEREEGNKHEEWKKQKKNSKTNDTN